MDGLKDSDVRTKLLKLGKDDYSIKNIVKFVIKLTKNSPKTTKKLQKFTKNSRFKNKN